MPRLFIAIRPPDDVRAALLAAMGGVRSARWQDDDQLHLTLRFAGEVDAQPGNDLADILSTVHATPFAVKVAGVGHFEKQGRPSAVWAKVEPTVALTDLQRKIERACQAAGLSPERRKFLPHITLARLNSSSGPIGDFLTAQSGLTLPAFMADYFALFESHLSSDGASYQMVEEYPLS